MGLGAQGRRALWLFWPRVYRPAGLRISCVTLNRERQDPPYARGVPKRLRPLVGGKHISSDDGFKTRASPHATVDT